MSMKPILNNPDAFDKWMEKEEIEFKESPIQEAMKEESTSQSSSYYVRFITLYLMLYYLLSSGKIVTFNSLNKMIFWDYSKIPQHQDLKKCEIVYY